MTVLRIKSGAGGTTWEEVGGVGVGVPAGGSTGQILTKTSAADYATAWASTLPILANNSFLQGYRADGTTPQNLIGVMATNDIKIGSAGETATTLIIANGYLILPNDRAIHAYKAGTTTGTSIIGLDFGDNIQIGLSLAAGKNIYVPRLNVQGPLTLTDQQEVLSSTGMQILQPYAPTLFVSSNCDAWFNNGSGKTTFARDVHVGGTLYKSGVAYTHPDHILEHHYTGRIEQFAQAHGAKDYAGLLPLDEVERHTRETLRLPGARGEQYDLFARGDELLAYVEQIFLYLCALNRRLKALEDR